MGYNPKDLFFDQEGRNALAFGIEQITKAVSSTLGPSGNTVLIEDPNLQGGMRVTKDGVTVARSIDLLDAVPNLAVRMMREAAARTASQAGDGTTTSIVLANAILESSKTIGIPPNQKTRVIKNLRLLADQAINRIPALPVTPDQYANVATISANNDGEIGKIIGEAYSCVDGDGIVTFQKDNDIMGVESDVVDGFRIDKGFAHHGFTNNERRDQWVAEDVRVFLCDVTVQSIVDIVKILEEIISSKKPLLIIAPTESEVVENLVLNKVKGLLNCCVVSPPSIGWRQKEMMEDISALTGATYFNSTHGDHIGNASFADLGHVAKVSVYSDEVVIVNSESKTDDALVAELIAGVRDKIEQERNQKKKEHYLTRLSNLNGKVARIRVGGRTDLEQKEVYDRVEDAVSAVRSALKEGIVPGGGKALYHVSQYTDLFDIQPEDNQSMCIAKNILRLALIAPLEQIIINSGSTFKDTPYAKGVLEDTSQRPVVKFREGLNVEDDSWGDLVDMGVIDPMAVTRHALENAVAVACTIISTNAIITLSRSVDRSEQPVIMER